MVHFNSKDKDICIIFIHGMCQTIIDNYLHLDTKRKAKSCNDFEYKYIKDTDHFYNGKELEIGNIILNWISIKF